MSDAKRPDQPPADPSIADMPPLPRDSGSSLMSEVLPFNSSKTRFWKSKALIPALLVVVVMVLLFTLRPSNVAGFNLYAKIVGFLILFLIFFAIHAYTGSRRPLWVFAFPFLVTLATMTAPLAYAVQLPIFIFFRDVLPGGDVPPEVTTFSAHFVSNFFGAGMAEETLKIVPVLLMIGFGYWSRERLHRPLGRTMKAFEAVTVLDCVLAAMASGAAFIMIETFGQYYYGQLQSSLEAGSENTDAALVLGLVNALQLSIPRSLQGIVGHMAWNGIFAYFIGIGLRRKALIIPLALAGLVLASAMHGFWNSSWFLLGAGGMWVSALTTLVLFLAVLLKARQLEPAAVETNGGSIVVPRAAQAAPVAPKPVPAVIQTATPATPFIETPASPAAAGAGFALQAGAHTVPLSLGQSVSFAGMAGLPAISSSFAGTVSAHPNDPSIIGLTNLGAKPWVLFSAGGTSQTVEPNRTARLEAGTRIVLGDFVAAIVKTK